MLKDKISSEEYLVKYYRNECIEEVWLGKQI
jgi:hypothetical protein